MFQGDGDGQNIPTVDESEFFQARIPSLTQAKSRLKDKILRMGKAHIIQLLTHWLREKWFTLSLWFWEHNSIQEESYEQMKFEKYLKDLEIQAYRWISKACSLLKLILNSIEK